MSYDRAVTMDRMRRYTKERAAEILASLTKSQVHDLKRLAASRVWLDAYHKAGKGRTSFNWAPRYPFNPKPPEAPNGEIIEGEYEVIEEARARPQDG